MRKIDYDTMYDKNSGSTEEHVAVDTKLKLAGKYSNHAYEEGFASASGVRPDTASSGGRIKAPENKDAAKPDPVAPSIKAENSGLADS